MRGRGSVKKWLDISWFLKILIVVLKSLAYLGWFWKNKNEDGIVEKVKEKWLRWNFLNLRLNI